ncbi:MAG TPA: 2OG-Fe(II) oxygenase [Castellaniella sp.]|uniref:2OG-Fe(II) oxygenase n=1 Tax=Castellaniella sp. TaxID=1955812 RepID=UPI002F1F8DEF
MTDSSEDFNDLIQLLNQQGWATSDTAIPRAWQASLLAQSQDLWATKCFQAGEIGLGTAGHEQPEVRGDWIHWVESGSSQADHPFFAWMARFRDALNQRFPLELRSQEFHFARYAEGKGYQKHIDQHRGTDHRKVSIVLYLNPQWEAADGGELCLYQPYHPEVEMQRIAPMGARLVVFVSGMIPHAVLPCRRTRWSLAGWLRTDER